MTLADFGYPVRDRWYPCTQRLLIYLAFQSFDFERTRWKLFQKRVVYTNLDIYFLTREWCWWMWIWNIHTPYVNSGKCQHLGVRCFSNLTITLSYFTITVSILKTDSSFVPYSFINKKKRHLICIYVFRRQGEALFLT